MKKIKHLLTLYVVAMLIATTLILTSCSGGVESALKEVRDSRSFTLVETDTDGNITTYKVNLDELVAYSANADKNGNIETETYVWYDEEADKYYMSTKEENVIKKQELKKFEFITYLGQYSGKASEANEDIQLIELYDENDGVYSLSFEQDSVSGKAILKIDDDGNLVFQGIYSYNQNDVTVTKTTSMIFSDVNDTEVVIPDDVIAAEAKAVE